MSEDINYLQNVLDNVPKNTRSWKDPNTGEFITRECTELENLQTYVFELDRYLQIACNYMNRHKVFNKEIDKDLFMKYCDSFAMSDFVEHGVVENELP